MSDVVSEFEVDIDETDINRFAELSGDRNPLHTDAAYAEHTAFRHRVLHGAFSAGMLSRLAGMHIPGPSCLLRDMHLRFLAPIFPPVRVKVRGRLVRSSAAGGLVHATITDATSSLLYVEGRYEYGFHDQASRPTVAADEGAAGTPFVLVTGAAGGIGRAVLRRLGDRARAVSGISAGGIRRSPSFEEIAAEFEGSRIEAIVHCGWPRPDNRRLCHLGPDCEGAVGYHVGAPLGQIINLARLLETMGQPGATLILFGSTAAMPGRHAYKSPLYSLAKAMVPTMVRVLALELASSGMKCVGLTLDVVDGDGMNSGMDTATRLRHEGRHPFGLLPTPDDVAEQIEWILSNSRTVLSGAMVNLTGGALP